MDLEERINGLEAYKRAVEEWRDAWRDDGRRRELRTYINQNTVRVRQEVIEAGCFVSLTIGPPPAVGGLAMRDVDPFAVLFEPPYGMSMSEHVVDMIDRTIGVLRNPPRNKQAPEGAAHVEREVVRDYAFVAMAIDPENPDLEDVLDAIKEAAARCGIQAERVDEVQSNERITDRILESIRKAEFVIADLTHSKPNVFYEAGYAQGVGKTPIYVARDGTRLEFDLKDYPVIFFKNMKQLKDGLEGRLRALAEARGA